MPRIRYIDGQIIQADPGQTILEAAIAAKVRHMAECGGHARCTTCRVQVMDGLSAAGQRTEAEGGIANRKGWTEDVRLACQTRVTDDMVIRPLVSNRSDLLTLGVGESDRPAGEERELAVMFCDLRNFTAMSEGMLPHDVMFVVNSYATQCSEAILQNDGYIDKYMGDGIMAVFGLSDRVPGRVCRNAVRAGLNIQRTAERLTRAVGRDFDLTFRIGVGIHHGPCVVGEIGHPAHRSFSLLGDTVNAASRIESMTKELGTDLLISDAVQAQAGGAFDVREPHAISLRGKSNALNLYPVRGMAESDPLQLVQQSLPEILPHRKDIGSRFYAILFEKYPHYRGLFPDDMEAQSVSLVNMIETTVISACRPGELRSGLLEMGRRHIDYGVVERESFDHVGSDTRPAGDRIHVAGSTQDEDAASPDRQISGSRHAGGRCAARARGVLR